ncbi:DUF4190 domain-containing protein [Streptomyces sp. NPDC057682]|uniref:DUF4190 domain-containing protein n=1 Tax=Streptomyces sp. NPDC057682 TaxID=3346210 RepID=UPI00368F4297
MSDNTERPADAAAPRDPWAAPDSRVPLEKNTANTPAAPSTPEDAASAPAPSPVHDQQTVAAMPGQDPAAPSGPGGPDQAPPAAHPAQGPAGAPGPAAGPWQGPGAVPPPPVGPNGPGQPAAGPYGYPAPAGQGQYGYPAGAPQYGDYAGYPGYTGYPANGWGPAPANGLGIASLVLGIISVVLFCLWGLGIVLGVLALIFGLIGRGRAKRGEADNAGVALAGIILGSVGMVVSAAFLGLMIWGISSGNFDTEESDTVYEPTSLVVDVNH